MTKRWLMTEQLVLLLKRKHKFISFILLSLKPLIATRLRSMGQQIVVQRFLFYCLLHRVTREIITPTYLFSRSLSFISHTHDSLYWQNMRPYKEKAAIGGDRPWVPAWWLEHKRPRYDMITKLALRKCREKRQRERESLSLYLKFNKKAMWTGRKRDRLESDQYSESGVTSTLHLGSNFKEYTCRILVATLVASPGKHYSWCNAVTEPAGIRLKRENPDLIARRPQHTVSLSAR